MNIQRMKFAWARGARIQTLYFGGHGDWRDCLSFPVEWSSLRIHPDDEHLAYGPISAELRRIVEVDDDVDWNDLTYGARELAISIVEMWESSGRHALDMSRAERFTMFGFVAEYLADEGL